MYLTYERYVSMGGALDAGRYERLERKARRRMDALTHGRLLDAASLPDCVTGCMFDLVGALASEESESGASARRIASMGNDGVSVSYEKGSGRAGDLNEIVRAWLTGETDERGVHLLYAGA